MLDSGVEVPPKRLVNHNARSGSQGGHRNAPAKLQLLDKESSQKNEGVKKRKVVKKRQTGQT